MNFSIMPGQTETCKETEKVLFSNVRVLKENITKKRSRDCGSRIMDVHVVG